MSLPNIFDATFEYDDADPSGYRASVVEVSQQLGAKELSVRLFEVQPGEALCPYHYEYVEEWLIVLDGPVTVRVPDGEPELRSGDVMHFPAGPDGAHKVANPSGEKPARFLMFSSAAMPAVSVYPDSGKIGVWSGNEADMFMFRRADGKVDYYDGEV